MKRNYNKMKLIIKITGEEKQTQKKSLSSHSHGHFMCIMKDKLWFMGYKRDGLIWQRYHVVILLQK